MKIGKIEFKIEKKHILQGLHILTVSLMIPLLLMFSSRLITGGGFFEALSLMIKAGDMIFPEIVILGIFVWLFYGISGSFFVADILVGMPYISLTLISYYKSVINGTPLLLGDLKMAGAIGEISRFALPQIRLSGAVVCGILIPFIFAIPLFVQDKRVRIRPVRLWLLGLSLVLTVIFAFSPVFCHWVVDLDKGETFQEQKISQYGPFMGMYCTYAQGKKAGEIYKEDKIMQVKAQVRESEPVFSEDKIIPSVIFLMSESFFDVSKLDNVTFSPDPTPNFHRISKKFQSGDFISSTYCGGTGNVEMEVLTGICSKLLKEGDTLPYLSGKDVYKKIPTIADVFKSYGYERIFLHSYNSQLYNRGEIYEDFGFDKILFEDSFESPDYSGGYISDMALSDKIISLYEEKGDTPLFLFGVSMENHQPYTVDKFDKSEIMIKTDRLSGDELLIFDSFITGIAHADKAFGRLIRYFEKEKEPVMFVFFGDHLPNLMINDQESVFTRLGYCRGADSAIWQPEMLKKMLSTDYVIWTNYHDEGYEDKTQGSSFLGVNVLNRLGFNLTDYYMWLSERVMPRVLMYRNRLFAGADGRTLEKPPSDAEQIIEDYSVAVYDMIYGDNRIFEGAR